MRTVSIDLAERAPQSLLGMHEFAVRGGDGQLVVRNDAIVVQVHVVDNLGDLLVLQMVTQRGLLQCVLRYEKVSLFVD